jgi:hypothetical protein
MLTSWQTTAAGILAAVGQLLQQSTDPVTHAIGVVLSAAAVAWLGGAARQWNVTSEQSRGG